MSGHVYDYEIDLNGDSAPARIIRLCGKHRRVLEIGAGPGSIAKILIEKMDCTVVCLERDESAVKILKGFCRSIYKSDLNDPEWPKTLSAEQPFDVVIIADVLEHLYDPWRVLADVKNLINPGGSVLLSIPHSGHKTMLASALCSDIEYRNWGLLDRTHIRFFGMKNIQQLIEQAGLQVTEAEFVVRPPDMMELSTVWSRLDPSVQSLLDNIEYGDVYQVVARLTARSRSLKSINLLDMKVILPADAPSAVRLIAFYLPQFHPVEENSAWWGKGFTEWTNVTKAKPLFSGHYQPHLPADLGFYDLRIDDVRREQIQLAKEYGIDGFCYHFYWFSGRRILERPLENMLADPQSDLPFCLCWANENWTRKWDGQNQEVLLEQKYLPDDDERCVRDMLPYLKDKRYIKFNNRVLIIVYNPGHLENPVRTAKKWRKICEDEGLGNPYLVVAQTFNNKEHAKFGFDASVEFPPHNLSLPTISDELAATEDMSGFVFNYPDVAEEVLKSSYYPGHNYGFRTVVPSWDNTSRVGSRAGVLLNATPENYAVWLSRAITKTRDETKVGDRLVFINAWNEWAEGCHLEPDRKHGHQFLNATRCAKKGLVDSSAYPVTNLDTYRSAPDVGLDLYQRLEHAEKLAMQKSIEVVEMYNSLSWKVTAPFRAILSKLGVKDRRRPDV